MMLYKYYPCNEFTFKSLAVRSLWCHYPKNMNDPFECLAQVERTFDPDTIIKFRKRIADSSVKSFKLIRMGSDQDLIVYMNKIRRRIIEKYAFCALSEKYDDILMWSYYSNGHKGIVLGFEFDNFSNRHIFQKVKYKDSLDDYDLTKWADFMEGQNDLSFILNDISIKAKIWEREAEWRIWQDKPGYMIYQPHEVKELYFGLNCELDVQKTVFELLNYVSKDFLFTNLEFRDNPIRLDKGQLVS